MKFLFVLFLAVGANAMMECRYACDDPIVYATCSSKCEPPRCEFQNCTNCERTPVCSTVCPDDDQMLCAESCPVCEIQCEPIQPCDCDPVCEQPVCGWVGRKPSIGQSYPRCELSCEKPACEFVESKSSKLSVWN